MKILIAKTAGFCMGVRRVVDLAMDHAANSSKTIYTLGPLIHNNQTLDMLKNRGVTTLEDGQKLSQDASIIIRAHGVPPETQQRHSEGAHAIIDGTCPKVKNVHRVIERHKESGFTVVIAGDEGHPEVIGLLGYAGNSSHLIQSVEDVDRLPPLENVCLVAQTTFDNTTFDEIAARIREKYGVGEVVVKKTICSATDRRQEETKNLAAQVDAMIVVGGKDSANTLRLAKIAAQHAPVNEHVETEGQIDWESLSECKTIGITAGASTPSWMIQRVVEHLQFLDHTRHRSVFNTLWQIFDIMTNLNVFVSVGAAVMYYASGVAQGFQFSRVGASLCFLYMSSMYLWNSLTSIDSTRHLGISRYQFYNVNKRYLFILAIVFICLILLISYGKGPSLFYPMLVATVVGSIYHFTIVPKPLRSMIRYKNLKDIPTSRDLFVALAWGVLVTFIPHAIDDSISFGTPTILFFAWMFFLAYLRSLIFELRDIQGDRIMGRETLVTIIGGKKVSRMMYASLWSCFVALIIISIAPLVFQGSALKSYPIFFWFQIPVLIYLWSFMKWNHLITSNRAWLFNLFADGQFFVAGAGAWLATAVGA